MKIRCVWEHNGDDSILYSDNFIGAFTRGESQAAAVGKMRREVISYLKWANQSVPDSLEVDIVQDKESSLSICDADSDVLFESECKKITIDEYEALKSLALKSASDFLHLYEEIPDKNKSSLPIRQTLMNNGAFGKY